MPEKKRFLKSFFTTHKAPFIAAIASGLYPVIFYYTHNFSLINSWKHLGFFICFFLLVPVGTFLGANRLFKIPSLQKWNKYVLPFLNVFTFLMFIQLCLYARLQWLFTVVVFVTAFLFSVLLYRHLKKIIVLQCFVFELE